MSIPSPYSLAKDQDVTAEFRPRIERLLAGWSTLDTKNVAPFYAKDAGLVFFDVAPLKYSGWTDYEKGFQQVAGTCKSIKISLGDFQATRNTGAAAPSGREKEVRRLKGETVSRHERGRGAPRR